MDYDDKIDDLEELNEENVGFRFLYNKDQMQSSAMLRIQWCLAPQAAQYLKEHEVTDARVFVTVCNPRGVETRFVFPLSSTEELLEFHCPGEHEISGTIVWSGKDAMFKVADEFLKKSERNHYKFHGSQVIRNSDGRYLLGQAELLVTVADGFFAKKLSPFEDWYLNLWYSEAAWDGCEIDHRRMIAYFVQTPLLALWIPFIFTVRVVVAFWVGVVCLREGVQWEAVVHPFSFTTEDVWKWSSRRWEEKPLLCLLVPLNQMGIIVVSFFLGLAGATISEWSLWWTMASAYGALMVITITISIILPYLPPLITEETKEQWKRNAAEREERLKAERFGKIYSDVLLCTTVPADGTLPTKRSGFKSYAVLTYHDLKVRMCRPTARG